MNLGNKAGGQWAPSNDRQWSQRSQPPPKNKRHVWRCKSLQRERQSLFPCASVSCLKFSCLISTKAAEWGTRVRAGDCRLMHAMPRSCEDQESGGSSASVYLAVAPSSPPEHRKLLKRTRDLPWSASQTHKTGSTRPLPAGSPCTWPWRAPPCRPGEGAAEGPALCLCPAHGAAGSVGPACALWWARCAGSRAGKAAGRHCPLKSPRYPLACGWRRSGSCRHAEWWWRCRCSGPVFSPVGPPQSPRVPLWSGCHSRRQCDFRPERQGADPLWLPGTPSDPCSRDTT